MLAAILGGDISENSGSTETRKEPKKAHGEIASPVARRLFTADTLMIHHITRLTEEHESFHGSGEVPPEHDCRVYQARLRRLLNRRGLLHNLLWQAIIEEHPQVAANEPVICDGWTLVDGDQEWIDNVPSDDKTNFTYNYVGEVASIINGSSSDATSADNNLMPVGEGEEIIGTLEDTRVRALWALILKVSAEYQKQIADAITEADSLDEKTLGRMSMLATHLARLAEISESLFWCGVEDTIPSASMESGIGIRESWKVVKYTPTLPTRRIVTIIIPVGSSPTAG